MGFKFNQLSTTKFIGILLLFLGFSRYYLGPIAFLSYFLSLFYIRYKLKLLDWFLFLSLFILFILATLETGIFSSIMVFGFHWGFIFYYLFFKRFNKLFNIKILFYVFSLVTIIEGILVNTILEAKNLPNYPIEEATSHFSSIWQRSYSFGGNSSVTGVLIITLLTLLPFSKLRLLLVSVVMVFSSSASGVFSFFVYSVINLRKFWKWSYLIIIFFIGLSIYFLNKRYGNEVGYFSKISFDYISLLLNDKSERLVGTLRDMNFTQHIFGTFNPIYVGGDFSFLNFYRYHGVSGLIILGSIILTNLSSINKLPIFLLIFFSLHYYIIFSAPGQIILGYLLSLNRINKNTNLARIY
tara:strand:+ start:207 stop:1268 length:1062 start_codon:yes stop_codon:yes gene_type:complete